MTVPRPLVVGFGSFATGLSVMIGAVFGALTGAALLVASVLQ